MSQSLTATEQAFINEVGSAFLNHSRAPHPDALSSWRPSGITWPIIRTINSKISGLKKRDALVDGSKMVWLEGGNTDGPAVVLMHGFSSSKENWLPLVPLLSRHYHIYVPDLPGWGESHFNPQKSYGIDHQSERISHWLEQHVNGPVHIVGSSMGGALAGYVSARSPEQIRSLTLMNAAGARGSELNSFEEDLLIGRNSLVAHRLVDVVRLLTITTHRNRHLLAGVLTPLVFNEIISRRHVNRYMFRELLGHAPQQDLPGFGNIITPTFILWGEQDKVLNVSCVDTFMQIIPHAEEKRLRGIGHLPMIEAPALTARYLRRFWEKNPA